MPERTALLTQHNDAPRAGAAPRAAVAATLSAPGRVHAFGRAVRHFGLPALMIAVVLALWEVAGRFAGLPDYILPSPSHIAAAFTSNTDLYARHVPITAFEALVGFTCGNTFAILLAISFVHSRTVERSIYPMAVAFRSVPFVALAPILVIWLGNGLAPKAIIAGLVSFFPTLVNMVRGLRSVDPEALDLMHTLSASWWQILWRLRWPSAMPFLFSALKISAAGTLLGAVVAEWIGSDLGIGYLVVMSTYEFKIPLLWATIAVTSALAMTLFGAVLIAERIWSYDMQSDAGG